MIYGEIEKNFNQNARLGPKNTSEPHFPILGARLMVSRSVFKPFENPDFAIYIYIYTSKAQNVVIFGIFDHWAL